MWKLHTRAHHGRTRACGIAFQLQARVRATITENVYYDGVVVGIAGVDISRSVANIFLYMEHVHYNTIGGARRKFSAHATVVYNVPVYSQILQVLHLETKASIHSDSDAGRARACRRIVKEIRTSANKTNGAGSNNMYTYPSTYMPNVCVRLCVVFV